MSTPDPDIQSLLSAKIAVAASQDVLASRIVDALQLAMQKFANSGQLGYYCYWSEERLAYCVRVNMYLAFRPKTERNIDSTRELFLFEERLEKVKSVDDFSETVDWLANLIAAAFQLPKAIYVQNASGDLIESTLLDSEYWSKHLAMLEQTSKDEAEHLEALQKHAEREAMDSIMQTMRGK